MLARLLEQAGEKNVFNNLLVSMTREIPPAMLQALRREHTSTEDILKLVNVSWRIGNGIFVREDFADDNKIPVADLVSVLAHERGHDFLDIHRKHQIARLVQVGKMPPDIARVLLIRIELRADEVGLRILMRAQQLGLKIGNLPIEPKMLFDAFKRLHRDGRMSEEEMQFRLLYAGEIYKNLKKEVVGLVQRLTIINDFQTQTVLGRLLSGNTDAAGLGLLVLENGKVLDKRPFF